MNEIEKKIKLADLYDFYSPMLTEKQNEILGTYCLDDLSLVEISENLGISRQAVYDTVKKAEKQLEELEQRLGLLSKHGQRRRGLQTVIDQLHTLNIPSEQRDGLLKILIECMD